MAARIVAAEESKGDRWKGVPNGVSFLSTQHALEAMELLLEEDAIQTGVMSIDWKAWHQWTSGGLAIPPYLSLLISGSDSRVVSRTAKVESRREYLLDVQSERSAEMMEQYLAEEMAQILKVPLTSVDREKPIVNMGFDSLMSIELKNQIQTDLGVSVAMSRLIQSPTILELKDIVLNLLEASRSVESTAAVGSSIGEFEEGVL